MSSVQTNPYAKIANDITKLVEGPSTIFGGTVGAVAGLFNGFRDLFVPNAPKLIPNSDLGAATRVCGGIGLLGVGTLVASGGDVWHSIVAGAVSTALPVTAAILTDYLGSVRRSAIDGAQWGKNKLAPFIGVEVATRSIEDKGAAQKIKAEILSLKKDVRDLTEGVFHAVGDVAEDSAKGVLWTAHQGGKAIVKAVENTTHAVGDLAKEGTDKAADLLDNAAKCLRDDDKEKH